MSKLKLAVISLGLVITTSAFCSVSLSNKDSQKYSLLVNSSESCFSGTHTSIQSNNTTSVSEGWACLNENKPAVKLESGNSYIIKNGSIYRK